MITNKEDAKYIKIPLPILKSDGGFTGNNKALSALLKLYDRQINDGYDVLLINNDIHITPELVLQSHEITEEIVMEFETEFETNMIFSNSALRFLEKHKIKIK